MQNEKQSLLAQKIAELIKKFQDLKEQNEALRNEILVVKAQNENLNLQVSKLEDEAVSQNLSEDEILKQIESVLSE